jgi:uncharacterized iron-regulated protein
MADPPDRRAAAPPDFSTVERARRSLLALPVLLLAACAATPAPPPTCPAAGAWLEPAAGRTTPAAELFERLARENVVLLGEAHDRADHHRWQTQVIAGLLSRRESLVVGLEMLPRSAQPALDRWVAGALDEAGFLAESGWSRNWGFDFALYRPIFELARLNRTKMLALNVERAVVSRVGREGFAAARTGLGNPAAAAAEYVEHLKSVWAEHRAKDADEAAFRRFVEAQLAWDRAMAEAIAAARKQGAPLVVGIIGRGHLQHFWGVPRQLASLGERSTVLLPWPSGNGCEAPGHGVADAVFGIETPPAGPAPLRLGVVLERGEAGLRVRSVAPGSVAEAAGVQAEDVLVAIAGKSVVAQADVTNAVRRASPGFWIPLTIRRGGEEREVVAKFPP